MRYFKICGYQWQTRKTNFLVKCNGQEHGVKKDRKNTPLNPLSRGESEQNSPLERGLRGAPRKRDRYVSWAGLEVWCVIFSGWPYFISSGKLIILLSDSVVAVGEGPGVPVLVAVGEGPGVPVLVAVGEGPGVPVLVAVGDELGMLVGVGVDDELGMFVGVGVDDELGMLVLVAAGSGVLVGVAAEVPNTVMLPVMKGCRLQR